MPSVCNQGYRVIFFSPSDQVPAHHEIDNSRKCRKKNSLIQSMQFDGAEKTIKGIPDQVNSGKKNKSPFKSCRNKFDFPMPIGMILVPGFGGVINAEQGKSSGHNVDDGLQCIR